MVSLLTALLRRELLLGWRHGADTLGPALFFVLSASLFAVAVGPAPELLERIAPGVVWVCALLAALLPLDRMFAADAEDGTLDQWLVSGIPAPGVAAAKAAAHWLATGLPVVLAAVPVCAALRLDRDRLWLVLAGLLPGTLLLSLLGTVAAALVLGARRSGLLLPLLVLPLSVPVLVFATGAAEPGAARPNLLLLCALLCAALPACPLVAGAGLRAAVDS